MIPALGILLLLTHREITATQEQITRDILTDVRMMTNSIGQWVATHVNAVRIIAELGSSSPLIPSSRLQEELRRINELFRDLYNSFLCNAAATVIACDPRINEKGQSLIGLNFVNRAWFKELSHSLQPTISDGFPGQAVTPSPIFSISIPIIRNGKLSHFGLADINLEQIQHVLHQVSDQGNTTCTILDRNNRVMISTDKARKPLAALEKFEAQTVPVNSDVDLRIPGIRKNISIMQSWGNACYLSRRPIEGTPWTLVVEYSVKPMQKHFYDLTIWGLSVVAAFYAVMLVLATMISQRLSLPILSLASVSKNLPARIARHEEIQWPQANVKELIELIDNFEQAAETIGENITEINTSNLSLQDKTAQLELLTRNLEQRIEEEVVLRLKGEQILVQQAKLAAMGEMLGAISHQWRQPLNALGIIIQNIGDAYKFDELDQEHLDSSVQKSMAQIEHMSKTIDDFRNFFQTGQEKMFIRFDAGGCQCAHHAVPSTVSQADQLCIYLPHP